MGILDRFLGAKRVKRGAAFYQLSVSAVPDTPQLFGYKNSWLAIRSDSPEKVMAALELEPVAKANWATGLPYAGEGKLVYVSPCLDGFVLVVGYWEWTENRAKLDRIAKEFDEVQAFATHRVSETHAWMLYRNHQPVRGYFYADGQVEWEIGDLTPEELALGFDAFPHQGQDDSDDFPDEEKVLEIADAWGIDTFFEKEEYPPAVGMVCAGSYSFAE